MSGRARSKVDMAIKMVGTRDVILRCMKKKFIAGIILVVGAMSFAQAPYSSLTGLVGCETGSFVEISTEAKERIDGLFVRRIESIRDTPNMTVPQEAPKRYLSYRGDDAADGLSPNTAWRTIERLNREKISAGMFVLFERGGLYRGSVKTCPGVTYTAYGKGPKPLITVSPMDGADPEKWEKTDAKDVWRCQIGTDDVGVIVFDGGVAHAIKIVPVYNADGTFAQQYSGKAFNAGYADLEGDLHFWHDYSAKTKFQPHAKGSGYVYLKSKKNPGLRFKSIEFGIKRYAFKVGRNDDVTVDNISVMYVGAHGVGANTMKNLKVANCTFAWIGGSIQAEDLFGRNAPVRYGNAVEIWGGFENFTVENCYVRDVYDAAVTHQFGLGSRKDDKPVYMKNVRYLRNVIERCNYSIEFFLSGIKDGATEPSRMENVVFERNLMRDAATGFCRQRPDAGEGAHIKSWRFTGGSDRNRASGFAVKNNVFYRSGDMLVEISSGLFNPDGTDSMPEMTGNVFIGEKRQRFGVLNQGKAVELKYDGRDLAKLGGRYSGNVFAFCGAERCTRTIAMEKGECWWGGANFFGTNMPFTAKTNLEIDLRKRNYSNQCASFMISNRGRVIWSEGQSHITVKSGIITMDADSPVAVETADEKTLSGAYRYAMRKYFAPTGKSPDALFFTAPQLNTWIELTYNQNQKDILAYAKSMLSHGVPPGVIMIDDTWQAGYGDWRFEPSRFPDPKAMIDELHAMGYKVMLWMCPYVGMDLPAFRRIAWGRNPDDVRGYPSKGGFLNEPSPDAPGEGEYEIIERPKACGWWNGYSAFLDFSHPNANAWMTETLDGLVRDFGVDGFKLDGADLGAYNLSDRKAHDPKATSGSLNNGYCAYALKYPFCEIRNTWRMQLAPVVVRLHDKMHEWSALDRIVADMIAAGLLGHPFICPDMVGGGDWIAFIPGSPFDPELFIRSAQIHALCPMMQISASPWRVLDAKHQAIFSDIVALRQKFAGKIAALAKKAGEDGEPILRSLEYNFPGQGYADVIDQFMMGEDLLIAPVMSKGALSRKVVLPPGRWLADDGRTFDGPATIAVRTPLSRLPHFVRR